MEKKIAKLSNKIWGGILIAVLICCVCVQCIPTQIAWADELKNEIKNQEYVPGQLLITFADTNNFSDIETQIEKSKMISNISCQEIFEESSLTGTTALITFDDDIPMQQAITEVEKCGGVIYAQPNYIYRTADMNAEDLKKTELGNNFKEVQADKLGAKRKVTVAVLDSRIETTNSVISSYIDVKNAYNAIEGGNSFGTEDASHGTGVSQLIINSAKSAMKSIGMEYDVEILPVQTCKVDYTTDAYMIEACIYVKNMIITGRCPDLHIVNMSISGSPDYANDRTLQESIENLREYGVITVCAAGNTGTDEDITPADFSNTIAVCSLDESGNLNASSSWGCYKNIGAKSGSTSGASAVVSGAATALYAQDPELTAEEATIALTSKDTTIPIATSTDVSRQRMTYMDGIYQLSIEKAAASVKKTTVDKPQIITEYIYDGTEKTSLSDTEYYRVKGQNSAVNAGAYHINVSLKEGYVWSDYSREDIEYSWNILEKEISEPEINDYMLADVADEGVLYENGEGYTLSGNLSASMAGEYNIVAKLEDNYIWKDGTREAKYYCYKITNPNEIALPRTKNWVYSGLQEVGVKAGSGYSLSVTGENEYVQITEQGAVATVAGSYEVVVTPMEGYSWQDETEENKSIAKTVEFTVSPKIISVPTELEKKYTGQEIAFTQDEQDFLVSGQNCAVDEGAYAVKLTLLDTQNTIWADNTSAAKEVTWCIVPNIIYEVNSGKAYIKEWKGSNTDIVIPETIDGYDVFGINDYAFATSFNEVTSVVFPKNMWMIGNDAFAYCYDLKKIAFSDEGVSHLNWLGYSVFVECRSLEQVELPTGVYGSHITLEKAMFANCKSLREITIPVRFTKLADSAFQGCSTLEKVTLESDASSVITIGDQCFAKCYGLKEVTLPDDVTMIGDQCFFQCSSLEQFTIPKKVFYLGRGCFTSCSSLENVVFNNKEVPTFVSLEPYMFYECSALSKIDIPETISTIGEYAFYNCDKLTSIEIPDSLRRIGEGCFAYTSSLKSFVISSTNRTYFVGPNGELYEKNGVNNYETLIAFPANSSATAYTLPKDCSAVLPLAFAGNKNMNELVIPSGFDQNGLCRYCLDGMKEDILIQAPSKQIADIILQYCVSKNAKLRVNYPDNPVQNGTQNDVPSSNQEKNLEEGKSVADEKGTGVYVVLNLSAKEVAYAEPSNSTQKVVKIPDKIVIGGNAYTVSKVADNAFKGNKVITKVTLPATVTSIGKEAFSGCSKLTTVSIPKNVTSIGTKAFSGCKKLKTITIKTTKLTAKSISSGAFKGLSKNVTIKVPKKQLKAYKQLFKKKGFKGKVK